MSLKKNIFYNILLTISNLVIPILIFPYISRVLGSTSLGIYSFIDETVNYFVLFSTLGIITVGTREVAKNKGNSTKLNFIFSSIFLLHLFASIIISLIFILAVAIYPSFYEYRAPLLIGITKLFSTLFMVEWFFIGSGDFKFITIRSIITKILFIVAVFYFVSKPGDYTLYFGLTCLSMIANASVNWIFATRTIKIGFKLSSVKLYIKPFFTLGAYRVLTSLYTTFNIVFLGLVCSKSEVGNYTVAVKIESVIIAVFTAFSAVMMPHATKIVSQDKKKEFNNLVNDSFEILYTFAFPIVFFVIMLAPEIINLFSGGGYNSAIINIRIIIPLILIIGAELILINQILLPLHRDRDVLINSVFGAVVGIILNFLLVKKLGSMGSSIVWLISELIVLLSAIFFVLKNKSVRFDFFMIFKHILLSLPYIIFIYSAKKIFSTHISVLMISFIVSLIYFVAIQMTVIKNRSILSLVKNL